MQIDVIENHGVRVPRLGGTQVPVGTVVQACHDATIDGGLVQLALPGLDPRHARADPHLLRRAALQGG